MKVEEGVEGLHTSPTRLDNKLAHQCVINFHQFPLNANQLITVYENVVINMISDNSIFLSEVRFPKCPVTPWMPDLTSDTCSIQYVAGILDTTIWL